MVPYIEMENAHEQIQNINQKLFHLNYLLKAIKSNNKQVEQRIKTIKQNVIETYAKKVHLRLSDAEKAFHEKIDHLSVDLLKEQKNKRPWFDLSFKKNKHSVTKQNPIYPVTKIYQHLSHQQNALYEQIEINNVFLAAQIGAKGFIEKWLKTVESPQHAINQQDKSGFRMLDYAAFNGQIEIVSYLLKQRADPKLKSHGNNSLHWACVSTTSESIRAEMVNLLLKHTPANEKNDHGDTPLHLAAAGNQPHIVRCLLKKSNPNVINNKGETPVFSAVENSATQSALELLANKDIDLTFIVNGQTILKRAIVVGLEELIERLSRAA